MLLIVHCGRCESLCWHEGDWFGSILLSLRLHMRILQNKCLVTLRRWLLESHTAALGPLRLHPIVSLCELLSQLKCARVHDTRVLGEFGASMATRVADASVGVLLPVMKEAAVAHVAGGRVGAETERPSSGTARLSGEKRGHPSMGGGLF